MGILDKRKKKKRTLGGVQTVASRMFKHPFSFINEYSPLSHSQIRLYESIREAVPIIDAAIEKIIRLTCDFSVKCENTKLEKELNRFLNNMPVGASSRDIKSFVSAYLDSMLTYGTAVGEIVADDNGDVFGLYNAYLDDVMLVSDGSQMDMKVCVKGVGGAEPVSRQELVCVTALNPKKGNVYGTSLIGGLPFVCDILLKIYNTIGVNWERAGNVRYAITYHPSPENERNAASDICKIADEWSKAMSKGSGVSDFIAAGDVSIKVIGADGEVLSSEVPVRQMLEQIVAKLSIPPFLLGLSWSTTERMSSQQADILTSELEYYRSLLTPVISKICSAYLISRGYVADFEVQWGNINLQDEVELANARYTNAQAKLLEMKIDGGGKVE